MPRPRLLFLTPHIPDPEGSGSARRAASTFSALSHTHDAVLFHIAPDSTPGPAPALTLPYLHANGLIRCWRRRLARRRPALFAALFAPPDWVNHTRARLRHASALAASAGPFATIHAFRFYTAPYALAMARGQSTRPALHLDLDDIESVTRTRIASVLEHAGEQTTASREHANARAYARLEHRLLPRFDRLYAASSLDASRLRHPAVRVLPNTVHIPADPPPPPETAPLRILFIGSLGYSPNQDAIRWFAAEILPALRATTPCEFIVAGRGAPEPLRALLESTPGATHLGPVELAASAYHDIHLVVAPLRAGGGTRLKILEAFALGRPVVATSLALEGLQITPGRHALVADSAASFAAACARLAADASLRAELVEHARAWVSANHSAAALAAPLA